MVIAKSSSAKRSHAQPRGRGRPSAGGMVVQGGGMSRALILERALELARRLPLADLSMAELAKDLGVTPALIYYYLSDRDTLVSGVVNLFYKALVHSWPEPSGAWRADMAALAHAMHANDLHYAGVSRYLATHNRFRLFQRVQEGETDYGLEYFNRAAQILQSGGFTPEQATLAYHLLMQHVATSGGAQALHLLPADHKDYIRSRLKAAPIERYGGAHFLADAFPELSAAQAFEAGLELLLNGVEAWLPTVTKVKAAKVKAVKATAAPKKSSRR